MNDDLLKLLRSVDTPTVCNAIEVAQGRRGFNAFTRGTMISSDPEAPAVVGYAVTAKIQALTPPTEPPEVIKTRRMAYYKAMAEAPGPGVAGRGEHDHPQGLWPVWHAHQRGDARLR